MVREVYVYCKESVGTELITDNHTFSSIAPNVVSIAAYPLWAAERLEESNDGIPGFAHGERMESTGTNVKC